MNPDPPPLVGRQPEARAILHALEKNRSILVTGIGGVGKTALLTTLSPLIRDMGVTVWVDHIAPWGATLGELFVQLHDARALGDQLDTPQRYTSLEDDRKAWNKRHANSELKAKAFLRAFEQWQATRTRITLIVDDVSGISPSITPWLVAWTAHANLIVCTTPEGLAKNGTRRFWKTLELIHLQPLNQTQSRELVKQLAAQHHVVAKDPEVYLERVVSLSQGIPGEANRLVKYHSSDTIIDASSSLSLGQTFGAREERGIAIAPIIVAFAALSLAWRYVARAQGDMNAYVLSGIVMAAAAIITTLGRGLLKAR